MERSSSRIADVSVTTVAKLLVEAGEACAACAVYDEHVDDVQASRVQCDEIWAFCYAKDKTVKAWLEGNAERRRWRRVDLDSSGPGYETAYRL